MQIKPKFRPGKLMSATLVGSLALGGLVATFARAETGKEDTAAAQALIQSKLGLADAIRTAEAAGQGAVTEAEFEAKADGNYFKVTTQTGTTEVDHRIDPVTGKILSSVPSDEMASEQDESGESEGQETAKAKGDGSGKAEGEIKELAAIEGANVSLFKAVTDAEAQGGKAMSAEFKSENAMLAVDVIVADASGKLSEMKVDVATGKVTVGDNETDKAGDEDGEEHEDGEENEGGEEHEG